MAEQDQNDEQNNDSGVSDDDARQLLDVGKDGKAGQNDSSDQGGKSATDDDSTDWKAEADKWKKLSRKNENDFRSTSAKLKEYEDQNKTEAERLKEASESNLSRAEKAERSLKRREVAEEVAERLAPHATIAQIKAVAKRINGDSDEDMESDAEELFGLLAPAPPKQQVSGRPKEKFKGGGDPDDDDDENDPVKLAARIPRAR